MCCHMSGLLTEAQKSCQASALAFLTMEVNLHWERRYSFQSKAVPRCWARCNMRLMCCRAEATSGDHHGLEAQQIVFSGTWVAIASSRMWVRWATRPAIDSGHVIETVPPVWSSIQPSP